MDRTTIIQAWREVCGSDLIMAMPPTGRLLEKFASKVAAIERERCAKLCEAEKVEANLTGEPIPVEQRARELCDEYCPAGNYERSDIIDAISAALRSQEPAYGPDGSMSIHCQQDGCQMYKHPPECWSQGQAE